jgi:hypothetical protein
MAKIKRKPTTKPKFYIGIDPGVNTGLAVWGITEKKFLTLQTTQLHRALEFILNFTAENPETFIVVEDARLRGKGYHDKDLTDAKKMGAGSVCRDSKIWEEFLTDKGIPFRLTRPNSKLNQMAKATNLKSFQANTGYTERCTEHARCAAMLVWNY